MGTVSRVHTFASGAILTAAQLNNEFDNLLTSSAINGGLDATNLGVTAGQAAASKALVVDASRNLADATGSNRINNLALSGTFESTGAITASAGITSGGNIVSDTDSTDDLGTTGVRWANLFVDDVTVTNNVTIGGTLTLTGGITLNGNTTIGDSSADTLTVNSTITSNLIFTDATYDIGASGATRPRDLFLSRNAVMGGTLGVTGLITATGGVSGALTGDVTGNVTGGTISGTTGTFSGDVAVNTSTLKVDTSNNRVGIKNAGPSYPLDIGYTAGINQVAWRGSSNEIGFLTYGSSTDAGAVQLSSGGAAKILFDAAGNSYINTGSNFGVGTASPTTKLHVSGASSASALRLDETTSSANSYLGYIDTSGNFGIDVNGGGYLRFAVGGAERARITSTGAIEIPNQNAINELTFTGTDYTNIFSNTTNGMQFGTTGAGSYLALFAANAEAIHIDSSQRVGIGTSSPASGVHISDGTAYGSPQNASRKATLTISAGTEASADLQFLNANYNHIFFGDSADANVGTLLYDHTNNSMQFAVNGSERARITSGGTLELRSSSGGQVGTLQLGSDATYHAKVEWEYANNELAYTVNNVGSHSFNVNGSESARITSDGITFNGDTAAANALDDYEEGTYSVTDQSGAGLSFTVTSNRYVKIGKLVWISIELTYPTTTNTAGVRISLPFTNSTAQRTTMACVTNRSDVTVSGYVSNLPTAIGIIESAASPVAVTNASLSGKYVIIGGVYEAA